MATRQSKKKLWVVRVTNFHQELLALGETEAQAKSAIWSKVKSTNNFGYGLDGPGLTSQKAFFDRFEGRVYWIAPGEVKTGYDPF